MGKIIAYPKRKLVSFFRLLLVVSIAALVYSLVRFVLTGFSLCWLIGVFTSLVFIVFLFIKGVLNAVSFVVDKKVLYVYRSRQLLASAPLKAVKSTFESNKRKAYEVLLIRVEGQLFTCSNLEYEGFDLFKMVVIS